MTSTGRAVSPLDRSLPTESDVRPATMTRTEARTLVPLALFAASLLVYGFVNNGRPVNLDYFVPLADALLQGRLDVVEHPPWLNELVPHNGRFYVVYPPAPALLLVPFVAFFGPAFDQGGVSLLIGATNVALMAHLLERLGIRLWSWLVLAVLFAFGTIVWYSAQAGSSWHFAHVCAILFLLLAARDAIDGGPAWRMGLLLGLASISRLPVILAAPFFLAAIAYHSSSHPAVTRPFGAVDGPPARVNLADLDRTRFIRQVLLFAAGLIGPVWLYLIYNLARFGSMFTTGYDLIPGLLQEYQYRHGFFSYHNIGRNLFAMLLSAPRQVEGFPWIQPPSLGGLSILLTTPALLWAIRSRAPTWFNLGSWLAVGLIIIPVLLHADPGGVQFGYRYALDFTPILFLLAARSIGNRPSAEARIAIAISILVNVWGMWAVHRQWLAPP